MSNTTPMRKSGRHRVPSRKLAENEDFPGETLAGNELDEEQPILDVNEDAEDSDYPVEIASNDQDIETDGLDSEAESKDDPSDFLESEDHEDSLSQPGFAPTITPATHLSRNDRSAAKAFGRRSHVGRKRFPNSQPDFVSDIPGFDLAESDMLEKTINQWGTDACLPAKKRMRLPFICNNTQVEREATEGWTWYFDEGGKEKFDDHQKIGELQSKESDRYLPGASQDLLVGPYQHQKLLILHHLQCIPLDATEYDTRENFEISAQRVDSVSKSKGKRHGWMLNVGSRLQCLDWAPNHNGDIQYLALASSPKPKSFLDGLSATAPAFTPAQPTPSSLQIWTINTGKNGTSTPPRPTLAQVLCTDWGTTTQLKWCPSPRVQQHPSDPIYTFLGLLATVSKDGCARVLSIGLDLKTSTKFFKFDTSPLSSPALPSITTILTWLSPSHIATAHSDGSIAIHDISLGPQSGSTYHTSKTQMISPPYIPSPTLTLSLAYPIYPTLLTTSAVSGHARLLDLRSPSTDYSLLARMRPLITNMIFSPHLLSFLYNDESDGTIRATTVRSWGTKGGSARVRNIGPALAKNDSRRRNSRSRGSETRNGPLGRGCLDSGKVHTCIAWGRPDGSVMVCNPLSAVLVSKKRKVEEWSICVFRLEWTRKKRLGAEMAAAVNTTADVVEGQRNGDVRMGEADEHDNTDDTSRKMEGISRITQSYKAEKADYGPLTGKNLKQMAIFEEENAVNAVCWNPNLTCGGWLAVGWGNGLVRVEDIAV